MKHGKASFIKISFDSFNSSSSLSFWNYAGFNRNVGLFTPLFCLLLVLLFWLLDKAEKVSEMKFNINLSIGKNKVTVMADKKRPISPKIFEIDWIYFSAKYFKS